MQHDYKIIGVPMRIKQQSDTVGLVKETEKKAASREAAFGKIGLSHFLHVLINLFSEQTFCSGTHHFVNHFAVFDKYHGWNITNAVF